MSPVFIFVSHFDVSWCIDSFLSSFIKFNAPEHNNEHQITLCQTNPHEIYFPIHEELQ